MPAEFADVWSSQTRESVTDRSLEIVEHQKYIGEMSTVEEQTKAYRASHDRIDTLVRSLNNEQLATVVTCCPLWTVKDLIGHLRSEEHTSELQSLRHLVCRLLLEKKQ